MTWKTTALELPGTRDSIFPFAIGLLEFCLIQMRSVHVSLCRAMLAAADELVDTRAPRSEGAT